MIARTRIIQRRTRAKFTLFRFTSADLFFSCCDSIAVPRQRPGHHDQVPAKNNERRRGNLPRHHDQVAATHDGRNRGKRPGHHAQLPARCRGQRPGEAVKYLRRTTSATANNGLGTTIKYLANQNAVAGKPRPRYHVNENAGAGNNWAKTTFRKARQEYR